MHPLLSQLNAIAAQAHTALSAVTTLPELEAYTRAHLGKHSPLAQMNKQLGTLSTEEKRSIAPALQALRQELEAHTHTLQETLSTAAMQAELAAQWYDLTQPSTARKGSLHPITRMRHDIEDLFSSMGFRIADGPHIETEWHNFDALNIPPTHPARDMQDTFFLRTGHANTRENTVLRTHTSPVQVRSMLQYGAPVRVVVPGRVFRNEATDATHDTAFYQVEGLVVDTHIHMGHLKATMQTMLERLFGTEVTVRMRPAYFPFVEPGIELDMLYTKADGTEKWLEIVGAGMVHPHVLRSCGIDPSVYSGFAFGFGLTRLTMLRYGITDIRDLFSGSYSVLSQF
ncbi:phenylalanine--tRNA ligase subunit alpha [Candidatus Peribacteria bacterium]|nr:phenylalanine--tRNA ligase subunit alpha [Candidatus Peribacteria bacterium]